MLNKRIGSIVLVLSLSSSLLVGCNSSDLSSTQDEPVKQEQSKFSEFNIIDNEFVKVDAIEEVNWDNSTIGYKVSITNKTDSAIGIGNDYTGNWNSTVDDKEYNCLIIGDANPNSIGEGYITWNVNDTIKTLEDIVNAEFNIKVYNKDDGNKSLKVEHIVLNMKPGYVIKGENNQQKPADEQEQPTKEQTNQQQNNNDAKPARKSMKDSNKKEEVPVNNSNSNNALEYDRNNDGKLDHFDDYDDSSDIIDDDIPTHADNWDGGKDNTDENGNDIMESEPVKDSIYNHVDENGLLPNRPSNHDVIPE